MPTDEHFITTRQAINTMGVDIIPHARPEELVKMWFGWSGGRAAVWDRPARPDSKNQNSFDLAPTWHSHVGIKVIPSALLHIFGRHFFSCGTTMSVYAH